MAGSVTPQNAEQWISFLKDQNPPVRNSIKKRMEMQLQDKDCSLMQLGQLIKSDPVLCLHIVKLAGSLHRELDSVVTGIDHAISSIGMHRITELIVEIPGIRLNAASVAHKQYFRSIANSHHAAVQTRSWIQATRGGMFAEESYLAALFYGIGHWMLWYMAPHHMSQIQILVRERNIAPELAEKQVLGCRIASISLGLVEEWHISPLALETLQQDSPLNRQLITQLHQRAMHDPRLEGDELRSLNHLTQQKFFPVKLANWLAGKVTFGWNNEASLHMIDIINDYLRGNLHETTAFLHQNCVTAARQCHVPGTLSPAAEMLMIESDLHPGYRLTTADKKVIPESVPTPENLPAYEPVIKPKPKAATHKTAVKKEVIAEPELRDEKIFNETAQRFVKQPESFTQASEVLQTLIDCLLQGLGMERVAICMVMVKQQTAKVVVDGGFDSSNKLPKSSHTLADNSLFLKLYQKPSGILANRTNWPRIKSMLPGTFSRYICDQGCTFMSLFAGPKPVAIVYADREGKADGVQDFHHEKFKYLCSAAGSCLNQIYERRRENNE